MQKRWMQRWVLAVSVGPLTACAMLGGGRQDPPPEAVRRPMAVVSANGATVTVDDELSGSPVELRIDQQLVVRLRYEGISTAQWALLDFMPGVLSEPGPVRFQNQNAEREVNGGDQIWRFKAAGPGRVTLNFGYRPLRSLEPASRTVSFQVTVR